MEKEAGNSKMGNRLVFVGLAWVVSLLVTACVLPQAFGSWSETATMAAAAFLMLVFGPYLLVVGICDGMVGDVGWGLAAMLPFYTVESDNKFWLDETYLRLISILDFVSGMTDSYAVSLHQKLKGISL